MAGEQGAGLASPPRSGPAVVAPTNRVNVALPFGTIRVDEPSKEFGELTAIVAGLAAAMGRAMAEPEVTELRRRADALAAQFR
jgi:hypothetical protein